ncbi:MAG TPA: hypothetical protein VI980_12135 [Acidimicrobiia bacterium]|nr:hypothetical protein [Acidimicrobiia bacterium]
MSDSRDPFEFLRREAGEPRPSPGDQRSALRHLQESMAKEPRPRWLSRYRRLVVAVTALLIVVMLLVVPTFFSNPAQAALGEIATAARAAAPRDIPEGGFLYTRSERVDLRIRPGTEFGLEQESVAYLLPTVREVWRSPEQRFIQTRTYTGAPEFFDPATETAYYEHSLNEADHVGQIQTEQSTDVADDLVETVWPTDPEQLKIAMETYLTTGDTGPTEARMFHLATAILRESNPSPALRAAVVEVLAGLDLELVDEDKNAITLAVTHADPSPTRDSITLSRQGELLAEETILLDGDPGAGIPAGGTFSEVEYLEWGVKPDLT